MIDKITKIFDDAINCSNQIIEILNEYFTEDNVDAHNEILFLEKERYLNLTGTHSDPSEYDEEKVIQSVIALLKSIHYNILIKFPEITVTNGHSQSINIKDLYVKLTMAGNSVLAKSFTIIRSTFTKQQILSGYVHSHVPKRFFNDPDDFTFLEPCLGSGPIKGTIASLLIDYDLDTWKLFCFELMLYLRNESIIGVPYVRLSTVGTVEFKGRSLNYSFRIDDFSDNYTMNILKVFIEYFVCTTDFTFSFVKNLYNIALSDFDKLILISNKFIKWYNEGGRDIINLTYDNLIDNSILYKVIIEGNTIYKTINHNINYNIIENFNGFRFKEELVTLTVLEDTYIEEDNDIIMYHVLNPKIANHIYYIIFKLINYAPLQPTTHTSEAFIKDDRNILFL